MGAMFAGKHYASVYKLWVRRATSDTFISRAIIPFLH